MAEMNSRNRLQIDADLAIFDDVDVAGGFQKAKDVFRPGSSSFCHYAIVDNGQHPIPPMRILLISFGRYFSVSK
jgi:hypothetical protein